MHSMPKITLSKIYFPILALLTSTLICPAALQALAQTPNLDISTKICTTTRSKSTFRMALSNDASADSNTALTDGNSEVVSKTNQQRFTVQFAHLCNQLKTTPRTGWVQQQVANPESVADHSWRVALLSFLLHDNGPSGDGGTIDVSKCVQMAIVHDLAECIVGDIAPSDNIPASEKHEMEQNAMQKISDLMTQSHPLTKERLLALYREYEERKTKEAIAVKDLDLLDMILQADEYERKSSMDSDSSGVSVNSSEAFSRLDLSEFFDGTPEERFKTTSLRNIAREVHRQRNKRLNMKSQ